LFGDFCASVGRLVPIRSVFAAGGFRANPQETPIPWAFVPLKTAEPNRDHELAQLMTDLGLKKK
jgi:hypothetical protein